MLEPTIYRQPVVSYGDLEPGSAGPTTEDGRTVVTNFTQSTNGVGGSGGGYDVGTVGDTDGSEKDFHIFVIPEKRKLGVFSTALLIINRVVGTGIYSTPASIARYTDSVGASLLFWVLGGFMTFW